MVVGTLKAAAPAITTSAGDALTGPTMWPAFQAALRQASVFDAIPAEAMPVPFLMKVGMFTSTFTGAKMRKALLSPRSCLSSHRTRLPLKKL